MCQTLIYEVEMDMVADRAAEQCWLRPSTVRLVERGLVERRFLERRPGPVPSITSIASVEITSGAAATGQPGAADRRAGARCRARGGMDRDVARRNDAPPDRRARCQCNARGREAAA